MLVTHNNTIISYIQLHKILSFVLLAVCADIVPGLDSRAVSLSRQIQLHNQSKQNLFIKERLEPTSRNDNINILKRTLLWKNALDQQGNTGIINKLLVWWMKHCNKNQTWEKELSRSVVGQLFPEDVSNKVSQSKLVLRKRKGYWSCKSLIGGWWRKLF